MMETAKKFFKVGIYGQIQKMIDFLEKRYNISNGWLNFSYIVEEFPDDFKKTCYYLGLKSDTKVFGVNCMLGGKKKALMVISPPNCNKNWDVLTEINWWMYPNISYWSIEETKDTLKNLSSKLLKTVSTICRIFVTSQTCMANI